MKSSTIMHSNKISDHLYILNSNVQSGLRQPLFTQMQEADMLLISLTNIVYLIGVKNTKAHACYSVSWSLLGVLEIKDWIDKKNS